MHLYYMRRILRLSVTATTAIFLALVYFTAETVVDEAGYTGWVRSLVRDGWAALVDTGYADWFQWGAVFFAGASVALWADYLLRSKIDRISVPRRGGRVLFLRTEGRILYDGIVSNVYYEALDRLSLKGDRPKKSYVSGNVFSFAISIRNIKSMPAVEVFSDEKSLEWRIKNISNSSVILEISFNNLNSDFTIEIAENATEKENKELNVWHAAKHFKASNYPHQLIQGAVI